LRRNAFKGEGTLHPIFTAVRKTRGKREEKGKQPRERERKKNVLN
jgi:hypothetical protein